MLFLIPYYNQEVIKYIVIIAAFYKKSALECGNRKVFGDEGEEYISEKSGVRRSHA